MARPHATAAALAARVSLDDLAEAISPDDDDVVGDLLAEAIAGAFDAGRTQAQRTAAATALDRLAQRIEDANLEVDGYLERYPSTLPAGGVLEVYALDIAEWRILGGGSDTERYARHKTALAFLRDVAAGKIDLAGASGTGSDADAGSAGDVLISAPRRTFTGESLGDYLRPPVGPG